MKFAYLSLEKILRLHFQLLKDYGGSHGVRDEGRLLAIVEAPKQEIFRAEQYPGVFEKAAVYLRNIIGDRPFYDGNKRTGVTTCAIFMQRNGKRFIAAPEDLESFTMKVATGHLNIAEIAAWLERHAA